MLKELIARIEELAIADSDARRHLEKQDWELRNHKESLASADALRKSLNDEITERDRELREMDAEAKAHREAIQKKDAEIQEWLMQLATARNERDAALGEAESLRSQVPLESTREALKNAVAKLKQHKSDIAKLYELADEIGRGTDESIADVMKRQGARIAGLVTKLQEVTTERDRLQDGLRAQTETLSVELSARYAEIAELHKWATGLIKNPSFAQNAPERTMHYREIVERINSRPQLDLTATLPAIDWQAICIKREDEIARLSAKVGPLEKLYEVVKKHVDHGAIIDNRADIYDAVAETAKALSQLTA